MPERSLSTAYQPCVDGQTHDTVRWSVPVARKKHRSAHSTRNRARDDDRRTRCQRPRKKSTSVWLLAVMMALGAASASFICSVTPTAP